MTSPLEVDFTGAKAAFFCGGAVMTHLRDDLPGLEWADYWDLPGGGREGDEDAETCLLRELHEEYGLILPPERLLWRGIFPSITFPGRQTVFFGGHLSRAELGLIRFGDEGQGWEMMPVSRFLTHPRAVPALQQRTAIVWAALEGIAPQP